jgi:catechol 2,3-dioxygenase-like lactoylglutathione lyase family enzyme
VNHLGFSVESAEAVGGVRAAMAERGFEVPEIQELDGVIALFMKDPDGVRFEISYFPPDINVNAAVKDRPN